MQLIFRDADSLLLKAPQVNRTSALSSNKGALACILPVTDDCSLQDKGVDELQYLLVIF